MFKVDQFESMFRAAQREPFTQEAIAVRSVLTVTDRNREDAEAFGLSARTFLRVIDDGELSWRNVLGSEFGTAPELLRLVGSARPDLICTYRNLHSTAWQWPYSLGTHLDLLTQHTAIPVMVLPHPEAQRSADHALQGTRTVMAITDHLTGDGRFVNYGVRFTAPGGTLWLTHVEDEATFLRYVEAISKIPSIDTDAAREALNERLLKDPREYIATVRSVLDAASLPLTVEKLVTFGHHLTEYRSLIEQHKVDLLVLRTKDKDQLAMRGIAYELAVELRHIPLLML